MKIQKLFVRDCSLKISALITCSLAVHCHSLGMVVIALCHTSTSNAGQLNGTDNVGITVMTMLVNGTDNVG